jgi:predicted acetyltransferase
VTDFVIRLIGEAERRAAQDMFLGAMHWAPTTDERWPYLERLYEPGRAFGAFIDGKVIGSALSFGSSLALPGGGVLPMAAVTDVGVRADYTRRGVLTELMRTQLAASAAAGDVFAGLHASEGSIYGRFGYGIATVSRTVKVDAQRAEFRPKVPRGGEVHLVDADEALSLVPKIYERIRGSRPGLIGRPDCWWSMGYERRLRTSEYFLVAVHVGPDGEDGFAGYVPKESQSPESMHGTLRVPDMHGTPGALNDLWRFLLGIDLVGEVIGIIRPVDEPLEAMLVNQHVVHSDLEDELWLRLVDVPAALAGRSYGVADPVVLEVRDRLLPNNSGRYRVGPDGVSRTDDPAELALDPGELAMIYLGSTRVSTLAGVGRIEVTEPSALRRADRLFATDITAWCGTMF